MKVEDIRKEAQKRCDRRYSYSHNSAFYDGFIAAAQWRINSVWHVPEKKKPIPGKLLIVKTLNGNYDLCYYGDNYPWNTAVLWAYVKDLIPDMEN